MQHILIEQRAFVHKKGNEELVIKSQHLKLLWLIQSQLSLAKNIALSIFMYEKFLRKD